MTQLTKEHFEQHLEKQLEKLAQITKQGFDATATKKDVDERFDNVDKRFSDQTAKLLSKLATSQELKQLEQRVDSVEATLDNHTASLDTLLGRKLHKDTEAAANKSRFQRYDAWFKEIADKIDIHLES